MTAPTPKPRVGQPGYKWSPGQRAKYKATMKKKYANGYTPHRGFADRQLSIATRSITRRLRRLLLTRMAETGVSGELETLTLLLLNDLDRQILVAKKK